MGDFLQMMGWLCVILALLFSVLYLLKRFGPKAGLVLGGGKDLKMLGQIALGPKKNVVVISFLNKLLVLGVTDAQISLITEMDASAHISDEHTANEPIPDEHTSFEEVLDKTDVSKTSSRPD